MGISFLKLLRSNRLRYSKSGDLALIDGEEGTDPEFDLGLDILLEFDLGRDHLSIEDGLLKDDIELDDLDLVN